MRKTHIIYCILAAGFTLGIYHGRLALWKDDSHTPERIYPLWVSTLPDADIRRLEDGIYAQSPAEVTALLEDYLS